MSSEKPIIVHTNCYRFMKSKKTLSQSEAPGVFKSILLYEVEKNR
jgi:hypothetical protein